MQLHISIGYRFNETRPSALENQLLRSEELEGWEEKKTILLPLVGKILASGDHRIWLTVTGLEFHTSSSGDIEWRSFEDVDATVPRIPASEVPAGDTKVDISKLTNVTPLSDLVVYTVKYEDEVYALKAHESFQELDFRRNVPTCPKCAMLPLINVVMDMIKWSRHCSRRGRMWLN